MTDVDRVSTPSQTARCVSVMALVLLTTCAVPVVSVCAFPTTQDRSVMNVRQDTMDTQTVLLANVHKKALMAMCATSCLVSACVSQVWWVSSVTAVPLDSGSPNAQPPSARVILQELSLLILKRAPAAAGHT